MSDPIEQWRPIQVERLVFKPVAELEAGPEFGYCAAYSDFWWIVHPERGAIFYRPPGVGIKGLGSPQCNKIESFVKEFRDKDYPGALVVKIRRAFVPINPSDYR